MKRRHAYWLKPGVIRRHYDGRIIAVTFGVGRLWCGGTATHGWRLDVYWPREWTLG